MKSFTIALAATIFLPFVVNGQNSNSFPYQGGAQQFEKDIISFYSQLKNNDSGGIYFVKIEYTKKARNSLYMAVALKMQ
jgi:hypothetical protein